MGEDILLGKLNLRYQYQYPRTNLVEVYNCAPLKVQRPFYPRGNPFCQTLLLNTAGGIVESDRLEVSIQLQERAQVMITTASAGKIYRSETSQAQQHTKISIATGAYLEYIPLENIIFEGANYYQSLIIDLAENAHYLGWEINRFGRTARGETFTKGTWLSATEIWRCGKPLWIDRQGLWGEKNLYSSQNGLANQPVVGTLTWVGTKLTTAILTVIEQSRANLRGETGITTLEAGLICRYRGRSTTEVKNWFREIGVSCYELVS